jgi:ElaB/YqjD/DUF883 family membrane-anchored ribosome-binding protein
MENPNQPFKDAQYGASKAADEARRTAKDAMADTRDLASDTLERMSDGVTEIRNEAGAMADRVVRKTKASARDVAEELRGTAQRASDSMAQYVRDEPVKSVLIASVAGAAIVAVASLLGGSRRR